MALSEQNRLTIKDEINANPASKGYVGGAGPYSDADAQTNANIINGLTEDGPVPTLTIRAYCDIEQHAGPGAGTTAAKLLTNIDRLANEQVPFSAAEYTGAKEGAYPSYVDAAKTFLRKLVDLTGPDIDFTNPGGSTEAANNIAILDTLAEANAGAISDIQRDAIINFKDLIQLVETGQESFKPGQQTPRRSRAQKRGLPRVSFRDVQASAA